MTVEVMLLDSLQTAKILEALRLLGYVALMVPEQCGLPADCRNLICVPAERRPSEEIAENTVPVVAEGLQKLRSKLKTCARAKAKNGCNLLGHEWLQKAKQEWPVLAEKRSAATRDAHEVALAASVAAAPELAVFREGRA